MYKLSILPIFLFVLSSCSISIENIQGFFNQTYDSNHDGYATLEEFVQYYKFMQPDQDITAQTISDIFSFYDQNHDNKITIKEIIRFVISEIQNKAQNRHKQIHIGFTGKQGQMQIMWVSNPQHYKYPVVKFDIYPTFLHPQIAYASNDTYNVGHLGFHGMIYKAVLTGLIPHKRYYYQVGDLQTNTWSKIKFFSGPPKINQTLDQIRFVAVGDVGTFTPFGFRIIAGIATDNLVKDFNFVFLVGDIAYAGVSSQKAGQFEPIWDLFGELSEKFSAYVPFMPGVGNHEQYYGYTAYQKRYQLPRNITNQTNLWFSFDYGQLHVLHFSSQHPYKLGSQQFSFIQEDLRKARNNPNIKWIIVGAHRAMYTFDKRQYGNPTPMAQALQELFIKYKVDIVQNGHHHNYQRMWPVYKNKAIKQGHNTTHYMNPTTPIYVVTGTGGGLNKNEALVDPLPEFALKRISGRYAYGRVTIKDNHLKYELVDTPGGKVLDQWHILK